MPKKFSGDNNKAVEARARKAATKDADQARKIKLAEDKEWEDNDKQLQKKQQRKEEQERKKQQLLEKKAEAKALLEDEINSIKPPVGKQSISKVTRAQIVAETERRNAAIQNLGVKPVATPTHIEVPLEENVNRIVFDGAVAQTIDEAISVLNVKDAEVDMHPEKRLKSAYTSFEEVTMPRLKMENPTLRLSQLKQLLRKEWMKSSENPMNQRVMSKN